MKKYLFRSLASLIVVMLAIFSPQKVWAVEGTVSFTGKVRFVSDVMVSADLNKETAKQKLRDNNYYTIIDYDLNHGAGGSTAYIYIGLKFTYDVSKAITGLLILESGETSTRQFNCHRWDYAIWAPYGTPTPYGNGLYKWYRCPIPGDTGTSADEAHQLDSDLNRHNTKGADIALYYTRDWNTDPMNAPITEVNVVSDKNSSDHYVRHWAPLGDRDYGSNVDEDVYGNTNKGNGTPTYITYKTHDHSYTYEVTTDPTCTTKGVKTYTCGCGLSYTEEIDCLPHTYTAETVDSKYALSHSTCHKEGVYYYSCSECGANEKDGKHTFTGPKLSHEMTEHPAVASTCTATGTQRYYTCSRSCCKGMLYKDNGANTTNTFADEDALVTEMLNHSMTEHPDEASTCTVKGHRLYYTCSRACCKDTKYKDNGDHTTNKWGNNLWYDFLPHSYNWNGICTCGDCNPASLKYGTYTYKIENAGHLLWYRNFINQAGAHWDAYLTRDIDLTGVNWDVSIGEGEKEFNAIFSGQDHTIKGIGHKALFDVVGSRGVVQGVRLQGSSSKDNYSGNGDYQSPLVRRNYGRIQCSVVCNAYWDSNRSYLGGIAGVNENGGVIYQCCVYGTNFRLRNGTNTQVGGIVGINVSGGRVEYCYTSGNAYSNIGSLGRGGIVGENRSGGSVKCCYTDANVPAIFNNLGTATDVASDITAQTLASGQLAYTLDFYQDLSVAGSHPEPIRSKQVYLVTHQWCNGTTTTNYSNTESKEPVVYTHIMTEHPAVAVTCTADGSELYYTCSRDCCAGKFYKDNGDRTLNAFANADATVVAMLSHTMTTHPGVPATCIRDGIELYYTCSRDCCKDKFYKDNDAHTTNAYADAAATVVPMLSHVMTEHPAAAATCTAVGNELYYTCTNACCADIHYKDNGAHTDNKWADADLFTAMLAHTYAANGICTCGDCEAPALATDGEATTYLVGNAGQLMWYRNHVNVGEVIDARLTADISLSGLTWATSIGEGKEFKGHFDGAGHTISGNARKALFCVVGAGATVRGVYLVGSSSKNNYENANYQSPFVRRNYGTIENCLVRGAYWDSRNLYLGGITGVNESSGVIRNCGVYGTIFRLRSSVNTQVGGIVGVNCQNGTVTGCYTSGNDYYNIGSLGCGGIVGENRQDAVVAYCHTDVPAIFNNLGTATDVATDVTAQTIASGALAYALNCSAETASTPGGTCIWRQNLSDAASRPEPWGVDDFIVYPVTHLWCDDSTTYTYSNTLSTEPVHDHAYAGHAFCPVCHAAFDHAASDITVSTLAEYIDLLLKGTIIDIDNDGDFDHDDIKAIEDMLLLR